MEEIKLRPRDYGEYILNCPHCSEKYGECGNLHHFNTQVCFRHEDQHDAIISDITKESHKTTIKSGNHIGRRSYITIHFECENCNYISTLDIFQHKGETLMQMHKRLNPFNNE